MRIRRATPDDAMAIAEVEAASWRTAYRDLMPAAYLAALSPEAKAATWASDISKHGETGRKQILVVEDGSDILGFSLHGIPGSAPPGEGLLYFFYFVPEAWGRGFAAPLMAAVMEDFSDMQVETVHLWVLAENHRARRFYERLGWREDGTRQVDDYGGTILEALRYAISVGSPR